MIKRGINKKVLWPLQDAHAAKQLDKLVPGWRDSKTLTNPSRPAGPPRPAFLLEKAKVALSLGIKPSPSILSRASAVRIAKLGVRTTKALDERALAAHLVRSVRFEPKGADHKTRLIIVSLMVNRPHLAVRRSWLFENLEAGYGTNINAVKRAVEALTDLGVISRQNGYYSISKWFRTGTSGPREHIERLKQTLHKRRSAVLEANRRKKAQTST